MKKITSILMLAMVIVTAGACTKMKESPSPESITTKNNGGGGGGGGGNADVYIGLWKLEKTTWDGLEVATDSTFTVQLNTGGLCVWNWYKPSSPNISSTNSMTYILNDNATPPNIDFQITDPPYGKKTIDSKTGTEMVWKFVAPSSSIEVKQTLRKQ